MKAGNAGKSRDDPEIFLVRIYRRDRKNPEKVAGVVEEIGKEGRKRFGGPESLWAILTTPRRKGEAGSAGPPSGRRKRREILRLTDILKKFANGGEEG